MKCLICKKEIKPFHVFKRKSLFNKPVSKRGIGKTISMGLGFCSLCRHISSDACSQNIWPETEKIIYKELYASYTPIVMSPTQKEYTIFLFNWLTGLLPRGKILEIGSYDGYFLSLFKKKGWICQGIEPSSAAKIAEKKYSVPTINDFFKPSQFNKEKFDLVILKHVIEHVSDPLEFTKRAAFLVKNGGYLYIEVPNSYISLQNIYFPEFHVDHLSYFTIPSIETLIKRIEGFEIVRLESSWAYMKFPFLHILAKKTSQRKESEDIKNKYYLIDYSIKSIIENFKSYYQIYLRNLRNLAKKYKKIALWGSGSCGTQFAIDGNFRKERTIVVDPNPVNQNKYLTITGHLVHNPAILRKIKVQALLIASGWEDDVVKQIPKYAGKKLNTIKFIDLLKS